MKKNIFFLLITLIVAFAVWAFSDFSRDIGALSGLIVAALNGIKLFLDTAKSMRETFSSEPAAAPARESLDPSKPITVQIVQPASPAADKAETLKTIRLSGRAATEERVKTAVKQVLGENAARLWEHAEADAMLSSLAGNGFWLEGLVLAFEQNDCSFPANPGRVLARILLNQWTAEKLGDPRIVSLDVLHRQLGQVAARYYPEIRYPGDREGYFRSAYSEYEMLVNRIGTEQQTGGWHAVLAMPLRIIRMPFYFLKGMITRPFTWAERKIGNYATDYENTGRFHDRLEAWWHKYTSFKLRSSRFFDSFSIQKIRRMRRGARIIASAKAAGILDTDGDHIWFTERYWLDYFTARQLVNTHSLDDFLNRHVRDRYRRQYPARNEAVAIMAAGLHEPSAAAVELVLKHDPVAAARCFATLEELDTGPRSDLKARILGRIVQGLKDVEYDGNSRFCLDSIRALRSLSDETYYAEVALNKIPEIYDSSYHPEAAKLVGSFGSPVVDMLLNRLKTADRTERKSILIALGEVHDKRALPALRDLLQNGPDRFTKALAAVILATCFDDPQGKTALEKYLLYDAGIADRDDNEGDWAWYYFDVCGEKAIGFALGVMERANGEPPYRNPAGFSSHVWEDRFLGKLRRTYANNAAVENMLMEALTRSQTLRMTHLLVKALGEVKSSKAVPALVSFLRHEDDTLRTSAVNSLNQIGGAAPGSELSGLLYSSNLYLVKQVIFALSALKSLEAIPALTRKLDSDEVDRYYETDAGYPIALYAMEALKEIGIQIYEEGEKNESRRREADLCMNTAAAWCNAHLEDGRPLRGDRRTVAYQSLWNLYILKAYNQKAHDYYVEWIRKHPEDSI